MKLIYRLFAEFIGTLALVLIGCGSAVLAGDKVGYLGISLAFGLTVTVFAYAVGGISGGHFNPAVTLSQFLVNNIGAKDALLYILTQLLGASAGAGLLYAITSNRGSMGTNMVSSGFTPGQGFLAEVVFSFLFIFVILGVTSSYSHNKFAPIAIGLMLTLAHICLIPVTGTSLNPARSFGPALFNQNALNQLWIFVAAPLIGSVLGSFAHMFFTTYGDQEVVIAPTKAKKGKA
ncbi:MAG: MIP family channel protein [Patescibacteria group bacterium]